MEDTERYLDLLFRATIDPSRIAAIIVEPVQGEGGFYQAPAELMRLIRRICDQHGMIFVADEIQTGFARTGKMFAMEHYDVRPDIYCLAKSLGGGFPVSAVVGNASVMDAAPPGGLGSTYAGNPISCAAALAVLDVIKDEDLIQRANFIGDKMKGHLEGWRQRNDLVPIRGIRGPGAMIAFDVVDGKGIPSMGAAKRVIQNACENGLIILSCGSGSIRLLAPLTATDENIEDGMKILERALAVA